MKEELGRMSALQPDSLRLELWAGTDGRRAEEGERIALDKTG